MTALLLDRSPVARVAEPFGSHLQRLGHVPAGGSQLIDVIERSGLRGRGGASFPTALKWRSVAAQRGGSVVLANGAEGEPLSSKDRLLMETQPHLVLDGLQLAAQSVGARRAVLYVGGEHVAAQRALSDALAERSIAVDVAVHTPPSRYVAGEESAAVHFVNDGVALPTATPPRTFERGVGGRPTLVQNVETLARVALIARGIDAANEALFTLSGAVRTPGVVELPRTATVETAVAAAGGLRTDCAAVLIGGYFGTWLDAPTAWRLQLTVEGLRSVRASTGCGVIFLLPAGDCGVHATAGMQRYLAAESAQQCGPCVFGLGAIAAAMSRIAAGTSQSGDLQRVRRWGAQLPGRGACKHPDGAGGLLQSALRVFSSDIATHADHGKCIVASGQRAA